MAVFRSVSLRADCNDVIRETLFTNKIKNSPIYADQNLQEFIKARVQAYLKKARYEVGMRANANELNRLKQDISSERLLETLSLEMLPKNINKLLSEYWTNHNSVDFQTRWLEGVLKEVVYRAHNAGSSKQVEKIRKEGKIPEQILIETILNRLQGTGLNTETPERVWLSLSPSNFGDLLIDRKLIIDETFRGKSHGHLIHLIHMDMLRLTAKNAGIPLKSVGDLVEFMGRDQKLRVEDFTFEPLEGIWDVYFDSLEQDFSRPEILNLSIETAFGWRGVE